ncbi:hypothetical protein [Methanosarcina sp. WH1]|uniref:hypothetical protein n=1 Tax=Methanosarcina sp. WH1 TaxID=1434102 RepID=UPI0012E0AADF|nr:hypothetical protein [Methanosarcina sp. WH1]
MTIAASGLFIGYQIKSAKELEIESRVHEQRKDQYTKLITVLITTFMATKKSKENLNSKIPFNQDEWFNVNVGMSQYASEDVLNAYINLIKTPKEDSQLMIRKLGDLLLMMREEMGFAGSNLTSRQVLSTFITDVNDSKYDQYFE